MTPPFVSCILTNKVDYLVNEDSYKSESRLFSYISILSEQYSC